MHWIPVSIIFFSASVVMYLLIRRMQKRGVPNDVYSFYLFAIPFVATGIYLLIMGTSFVIPFKYLLMIIAIAVLFSYFGNYFSQKGILAAPNPGYGLIIHKSYVVLTTLAAVVLFHAELTVKSGIAIACIVGFQAFVVIEKKSKERQENSWLKYSVVAFFCYGFLSLSSKYLIEKGVDPIVQLFYIFLIVTILLGMRIGRKGLAKGKGHLRMLIIVGLLSFIFNAFAWYGYKVAPNIGYINAVNVSSIGFVTLFSILLFKDEYNWRKIIGIIGVTAGIVLLFLPI